jgi:signal transduction histidine kinase
MHCDGRALVLEIRNDGIGGASMETAGSGLKGMADRAGAVAAVSPSSLRGEEARVRATIPVDTTPQSPAFGS